MYNWILKICYNNGDVSSLCIYETDNNTTLKKIDILKYGDAVI